VGRRGSSGTGGCLRERGTAPPSARDFRRLMSRGLGGRRPAGLLPVVWVAALVLAPSAAENVTVVQYKGFQYRTRDGASPTVSASSLTDVEACEGNWAALPSGFSIAPSSDSDDWPGLRNDDAYALTKAYDWHTCCLAYGDGVARKTLCSSAGSWWDVGGFCGGADTPPPYGGSALDTNGSHYRALRCTSYGPKRILVRRPCAAGSFGGPNPITYTQAASATCTPCPAGKPLRRSPPAPSLAHSPLPILV